jgi:hypothetical protein
MTHPTPIAPSIRTLALAAFDPVVVGQGFT